MAWSSWAGFRMGSTSRTWVASMMFSPLEPVWRGRRRMLIFSSYLKELRFSWNRTVVPVRRRERRRPPSSVPGGAQTHLELVNPVNLGELQAVVEQGLGDDVQNALPLFRTREQPVRPEPAARSQAEQTERLPWRRPDTWLRDPVSGSSSASSPQPPPWWSGSPKSGEQNILGCDGSSALRGPVGAGGG